MQRPQPFLLAVAALVLFILRHCHADPLCQCPNRVRIAQSLNFHLEIDHAAALVAAEAIIHALIRRYGEGSGLFPMERAQTEQVGTGAFQTHILTNHFFNGVSCNQFIQK